MSQRKPPERSLHNRTEAAKFIRMTLVRSTNLRDPADSALACATPEDKVKEALLGPHGKPRVPPLPMPAQRQGIPKTKVGHGGGQGSRRMVDAVLGPAWLRVVTKRPS